MVNVQCFGDGKIRYTGQTHSHNICSQVRDEITAAEPVLQKKRGELDALPVERGGRRKRGRSTAASLQTEKSALMQHGSMVTFRKELPMAMCGPAT